MVGVNNFNEKCRVRFQDGPLDVHFQGGDLYTWDKEYLLKCGRPQNSKLSCSLQIDAGESAGEKRVLRVTVV